MMAPVRGFLGLACLARLSCMTAAFGEKGEEAGKCQFDNEPAAVGSYWDPNCRMGMLGCDGDGKNIECRLCGSGDYINVSCPPSTCHFPNDPFVSYYWDKTCHVGKEGCMADGLHQQCRFCGERPYTNIPCPDGAAPPHGAHCTFDAEPDTPYYYEPGCKLGKHGCNADGKNVHCRFCGKGVFKDIPCEASQVCKFKARPTTPFFWDTTCKDGMLGCKADGLHVQCRFCAKRPFQDVRCPDHLQPKADACHWPLHDAPIVPSFWDTTCKEGMQGCWADGIHAQCRFCGAGVFSHIKCPKATAVDKAQKPSLGAVGPSGAGTAGGVAETVKSEHEAVMSRASYFPWPVAAACSLLAFHA